ALCKTLDNKFRAASLESMHERLSSYLKDVVNLWTRKEAILLAIEWNSSSSGTSSLLSNNHITIPNPRNPQTSITLNLSKGQNRQIDPDLHQANPSHWSIRVIRDGRTSLSEDELQEFLNIMDNATFGTL